MTNVLWQGMHLHLPRSTQVSGTGTDTKISLNASAAAPFQSSFVADRIETWYALYSNGIWNANRTVSHVLFWWFDAVSRQNPVFPSLSSIRLSRNVTTSNSGHKAPACFHNSFKRQRTSAKRGENSVVVFFVASRYFEEEITHTRRDRRRLKLALPLWGEWK